MENYIPARITESGVRESLHFRRWRGKFPGDNQALKATLIVSPIAEWFVRRLSAAAQRNDCASSEAKHAALRIDNFEIALDSN